MKLDKLKSAVMKPKLKVEVTVTKEKPKGIQKQASKVSKPKKQMSKRGY